MWFNRNGHYPIADIMRRLLTGDALAFNRRHSRSGVLLQNRNKSILSREETCFLELVRYIHLKQPQRERHAVMVPQIGIAHRHRCLPVVRRASTFRASVHDSLPIIRKHHEFPALNLGRVGDGDKNLLFSMSATSHLGLCVNFEYPIRCGCPWRGFSCPWF